MALTDQDRLYLKWVSLLFGWVYTFSWSASFYTQPLLNWRRRSTRGTSKDFPFLNVIGFSSYAVSTGAFLYSTTIRSQYAVRHPHSPEPTTEFNDFAFGAHAVVLCFICYSQYWTWLWGFDVPRSQRISRPIVIITAGCTIMVMTTIASVLMHNGLLHQDASTWAWIDVIYALGNVKLIVTFIKYIPQVVLNFQRKSTVGWSIATILFDIVGSILSLGQLIIDASLQNDWSGIKGNPVKLGLSNISICFDLIFIVQHYILYRRHRPAAMEDSNEYSDEGSPLLSPKQPT